MAGANEVNAKLTEYASRKVAGLYILCDSLGKGTLEAEAKRNAPWTDRTSLARQGLHGGAEFDGSDIVIYVAHTMEYGIYLELANAAKYAILMPTIDKNLEHIRKVVTDYWEGVNESGD
jgi:hypothetical protein